MRSVSLTSFLNNRHRESLLSLESACSSIRHSFTHKLISEPKADVRSVDTAHALRGSHTLHGTGSLQGPEAHQRSARTELLSDEELASLSASPVVEPSPPSSRASRRCP